MDFDIKPIFNNKLEAILQNKINTKTKPIGALGELETVALQIGMIQNTDQPSLDQPTILVFAGDHGIAKKREVNLYPQEVTAQMVYNFVNEGAAINVFCKQHQIALKIVDAGVNHDFENIPDIIHAKIDFGTQDYQETPAMTVEQCTKAIQKGADLVTETFNNGCNTIGFGEMGIGNTSAASLLMSYFTKIPIAECVGSGTGLDTSAIKIKQQILSEVYQKYAPSSPLEALTIFGGFEIAMITGGILKAAELKMTIIIDGFIVTSALLAAYAMYQNVIDYCIFAHTSEEQGHQKMYQFLEKRPLINLGMCLGEGTGVAIAYPIIESAVTFLNNMASFESAGVSGSE
ncbi:nicotinate-nucleotide-dimethylbenzimidazole phosphoribosyltransferase [Aquimarina sp. MAR_2010_214]|uniref:nicotinate-nucleotide--dimethylbenzimidazole phosphoribosyltransferase n=1 Tax=Aquimarina sp. MAR_2010_214 TaxID=1250026 RepID=UPI000C6FDA5D|nr:nicotinate-nucleotide--dimethylbenzimidazole phosphoribosyltransferase [Aquimarina sp. MAR_2010_214]PKV51845.1 nicotinate-nucleotide-dimethylbenzimidazole phosphoribosyltransferase [Aquimarina sp. MAR_2010_214]